MENLFREKEREKDAMMRGPRECAELNLSSYTLTFHGSRASINLVYLEGIFILSFSAISLLVFVSAISHYAFARAGGR